MMLGTIRARLRLVAAGTTLACGLAAGSASAADGGPVAKLTQVDGAVEYSRDGERWRPVSRNKYLFEGYTVRTGADGSAVVINQVSGKARDLGSDALIEIGAGGARVVRGELEEPQSAIGSFFQALYNKFSKAQRYTTVRRGMDRPEDFRTARSVTLAPQFPDLVWERVGPQYTYRLTIGDRVYDVPGGGQGEMVRFTVPDLPAGEYDYKGQLLLNGEVIAEPSSRRTPSLTWLDEDAAARVNAELHALQQDPASDEVVYASYLEDQGLLVAAMDQYHTFFSQYPEEIEMKPFLMKVYGDLRLESLRSREALAARSVQD